MQVFMGVFFSCRVIRPGVEKEAVKDTLVGMILGSRLSTRP